MSRDGRNLMHVTPGYQALARELGLDAETVFTHPDIRAWRTLPERDNATLDTTGGDGQAVRLHVKRHAATSAGITPAEREVAGIRLLMDHGIPTVPLVGWGWVEDGRSFVLTEDLSGYQAGDRWVESAQDFERLIHPVADLAARLHDAGLHHRDLYLCHVFVKPGPSESSEVTLRLIDAGRVQRLPGWPLTRRWIVKDLAQLWYSTLSLPCTESQRGRLIEHYARQRGIRGYRRLLGSIQRKSGRIARHDAKLRRRQPGRNISIHDGSPPPAAAG